jgi:hypothetical protein
VLDVVNDIIRQLLRGLEFVVELATDSQADVGQRDVTAAQHAGVDWLVRMLHIHASE